MQERDRRFGASHKPTYNSSTASSRAMPSSTSNAENEPALIQFDDDPIPITTGLQNMSAYID